MFDHFVKFMLKGLWCQLCGVITFEWVINLCRNFQDNLISHIPFVWKSFMKIWDESCPALVHLTWNDPILNIDYSDFFIWSPAIFTDYQNYLKIHVEKNDEFINVKLQNYFLKVLLPKVVTCKNDICVDNKNIVAFLEDHAFSPWLLMMLNTVILGGIIMHVWTLKLLQKDLGFMRIALQRIKQVTKKLNDS